MKTMDFVVMLAALVVIFISFEREGEYTLVPSFRMPLDTSSYKNGHWPTQGEQVASPVVTDLRGDGTINVVMATPAGQLKVLVPKDTVRFHERKRQDGGFKSLFMTSSSSTSANDNEGLPELRERRSASTVDGVALKTGRVPVRIAAGVIDKNSKEKVIVVLTDGWTVLCYDRNLHLLWETTLQTEVAEQMTFKEASILISDVPLRKGDRGSVVVGGRLVHLRAQAAHRRRILTRWGSTLDAIEVEEDADENDVAMRGLMRDLRDDDEDGIDEMPLLEEAEDATMEQDLSHFSH
eukprot:TRINITY_DN1821_c4_g1_i1.p1 TRINITY_DN1821_c4_g1~~TRINITY_DN1821_c4_g1_i1.p1  ORF type:complete len:294 (-),score=51.80 TRINITY_DN1821_c4_g1_i1:125-1006(-)